MPTTPQVTVVVVTWQGRELLGACLASLRAQTLAHQVVVVDNGSTDGTVGWLGREHPEVRVLALPGNTGFAGGVAAALGVVDTRFVALLNNDAVARPDWLAAAVGCLVRRPEAAAVTSRMLLADGSGRVNNAGVVLLATGYGADRGLGDPDGAEYAVPARVFGASGGAAVFRTLAVKAVGGVDPAWFMYYEDTDLSWRLRLAGWEVLYCPAAVVQHEHAASSDVRSAGFAFHNERNRLLTLARNAPAAVALAAVGRFVVTTASLGAKRVLGRPVPGDPVFDPALRVRALGSAARLLPGVLASRATVRGSARRRVLRQWRGVADRPMDPAGGRSGLPAGVS